MKTETPNVTLHMVSSLDGFIAKKDNNVSWLKSTDNYVKGITLSEEDVEEYLKAIDCIRRVKKVFNTIWEILT